MAIETISIVDASGIERAVYADSIAGAFAQVLKVAHGADGILTLAEAAAPLPVTDRADVAAALIDGRKTITTAGAAEAIRSTLACKWVTVTALPTNTLDVQVGGSGVIANAGTQTGTPLAARETLTLPVDDAAKVFIDVLVNGEGVTFTVGT